MKNMPQMPDEAIRKQLLIELAHAKMPFGKYKGKYIIDIPEAYLIWYRQKGFPKGKLGQQLAQILDIKINGLEPLIRNIRSYTNDKQ